MEKYRIKIETEKSGKKWYTAQGKTSFWSWESGKIWSDIGDDGNTGFYCGMTRQNSINAAYEVINKRRAYINKLDSETIIHIEYKDYEGN